MTRFSFIKSGSCTQTLKSVGLTPGLSHPEISSNWIRQSGVGWSRNFRLQREGEKLNCQAPSLKKACICRPPFSKVHRPQAVQATLTIIETFSKIRQLSRNIQELSIVQDKADQKALMQRSGEMIAELLDDDLQTTDTETSIELNFAVLKFKHTIKKKKDQR